MVALLPEFNVVFLGLLKLLFPGPVTQRLGPGWATLAEKYSEMLS